VEAPTEKGGEKKRKKGKGRRPAEGLLERPGGRGVRQKGIRTSKTKKEQQKGNSI